MEMEIQIFRSIEIRFIIIRMEILKFLNHSIAEQSQKIPLTGKVIWISQKHTHFKPQGFAIQLVGEKGVYYKNEAEKLLAGSKALDRPSYTM